MNGIFVAGSLSGWRISSFSAAVNRCATQNQEQNRVVLAIIRASPENKPRAAAVNQRHQEKTLGYFQH
jgi:hypothetical protein